MQKVVPTLNKTQLRAVLKMTPPGSHVGFIDWANIIVRPCKGEEPGTQWREVYIPYKHATDAYTTLHEMESVFKAIERVWGTIDLNGTKGLIKFKNKDCFYLVMSPRKTVDIQRL